MDDSPHRRADPANTFTYTLNLTQCFASRGLSFEQSRERALSFLARPLISRDAAVQRVYFRRQ